VIADLVVNHTSDQHPWFRSSRASPDSPYRNWYVWRDEPPADGPKGVVFPDQEDSLWQYDETAGQYYLHQFYKHQPDLNIANPEVRDELMRVIGFWLQLGLSGFRVDAVPFLLDTAGALDAAELPDPHDYLRDLRAFLSRRDGQAVLLGEVNLPYEQTREFFGDEDGDELTMSSTSRHADDVPRARPLATGRWSGDASAPAPPRRPVGDFVRNHDELTLDKLTDASAGGLRRLRPDEDMQLTARPAPAAAADARAGDPRRIRMVYSLLFSLPGTPVLFYGEEIGMGENLAAEGRSAVRTPMQWTAGLNGGFSTADAADLAGPVVEGEFGPEHVNVADQRRDPDSLLAWIKLLVQRYREAPEFSWGECTVLEHEAPTVLAHRSDFEDGTVIALHNFSAEEAEVTLAVAGSGVGVTVADLLAGGTADVEPDGTLRHKVGPYGCCWLRVLRAGDRYLV
jgi:maltose alpha-D-glucosyltransferase/alpha-amylase